MPNPDSTVDDYPVTPSNGNGGFKHRTAWELKESAQVVAARTMARYREAATILAKNKKELAYVECGLEDEGNSERKERAIRELLK